MRSAAILAMLSAAACVLAQPNGESFTPGRIFVSEFGVEGCFAQPGPLNWIREIDPATGESSIFADPSDGLCDNSGLIFTPDGKRLRVPNFSGNNVMDFGPAGNGTIVYRDQGFGLRGPGTGNGVAFDRAGDFYVVNEFSFKILKFPASGGPPTVFADVSAGISGAGGMAFGPDGNLYAGQRYDVLRFAPSGEVSVFDTLGTRNIDVKTLDFDLAGNLFVGLVRFGPGEIYRYDGGRAQNRRLLATGFEGTVFTLTVAPDQSELYVVDESAVYAVDANNGSKRALFQFARKGTPRFGGVGIAVYVPPTRGDMNCDGDFNGGDIDPFFLALGDPPAYAARYPHCAADIGDMNGDGTLNGADIEPFFTCLGGVCP